MDALLAQLQKLSLPHEPIAHAAAMTVDEQVRWYCFSVTYMTILLDNLNHPDVTCRSPLSKFFLLQEQALAAHPGSVTKNLFLKVGNPDFDVY
jgi:hypothetical protein